MVSDIVVQSRDLSFPRTGHLSLFRVVVLITSGFLALTKAQ